jgi:hypothetical protein
LAESGLAEEPVAEAEAEAAEGKGDTNGVVAEVAEEAAV